MSHIEDARAGWREEMRSAWLYHRLAECSHRQANDQALFTELARAAEHQSVLWANQLQQHGEKPPDSFAPDVRSRLVIWLARRWGVRALRPILSAMKVRGMAIFNTSASHHALPDNPDDLVHHHQMDSAANLRAAVFGVNDGLISNASLILGMAGATTDQSHTIVLTGIAGLLAGAFSMASGEYVSVRSQREMYEYQIGLEREELMLYPEEEALELAMIYHAKGMPLEEARQFSTRLIGDPEKALDTLAREELGINPQDLVSPWGAAVASFFSFALGACLPLLPFLYFSAHKALWAVVITTALALFVIGAGLSLFTGRNALMSGVRMLMIGLAAGGATYFIGRLIAGT